MFSDLKKAASEEYDQLVLQMRVLPAILALSQIMLGSFCVSLPAYAEQGSALHHHAQEGHMDMEEEQIMTPEQPISTIQCDGCIYVTPKHDSIAWNEASPCHKGHCLNERLSLVTTLTHTLQSSDCLASGGNPNDIAIAAAIEISESSRQPPDAVQYFVLDVRRE